MKDTVVNYIISQLYAHTQPQSFNLIRDFHKVSPSDIIFYAWNITVCKREEDIKIRSADRKHKAEVYWKQWITCSGEVSYFVVYNVLANTLKTPLIAQCLRGRPETARQPVCSSSLWKQPLACDLTRRCTQLPKRDEWQNPTEHEKTQEEAKHRCLRLW